MKEKVVKTDIKLSAVRFSRIMKTPKNNFQKFLRIYWFPASSLSLLLLVGSGCQATRVSNPELTMQIQPTGQPGVYTVSGRTNLPDRSKITVQAVRSLKSPTEKLVDQNDGYAVLAKSQISVKSGQWQASLNLRPVRPDGQAVELWQPQDTRLGLQADGKVKFVAVTEPLTQEIEQSANAGLIRLTPDGKRFLQVEQTIAIEPPSAKPANPPAARVAQPVPTKPAIPNKAKPPTDATLPVEAVVR
jgi:hypothetical protein